MCNILHCVKHFFAFWSENFITYGSRQNLFSKSKVDVIHLIELSNAGLKDVVLVLHVVIFIVVSVVVACLLLGGNIFIQTTSRPGQL